MKLKLIQEQVLDANISQLTFDNVFSADYLDYVVSSSDGMGTQNNNAMRFINASGTEISSGNYNQHQIYGSAGAENYSRQTNATVINDAFWKTHDGVNIQCIIWNPYDENQQTMFSSFGTAHNVFIDESALFVSSERVRGFIMHDFSTSLYYNQGIISVYGLEY